MHTDHSENAYYHQFRQQLNQFCRHKAINYIDAIWNLHGTAIDPIRLYHISSSPEPVYFEQNLSGFYVPDINTYICKPPELPIPMCDVTTIHQLKLYAIKLMDELAEAKCGSDYARTSDIKDEMEKISDYLKQCLNPRGKIKMDNK
ncbi:MAG: hypothetical protein PHO32_05725, partial [Candidatus Cloacimonetes bacterium]|nr:hypothetical protein [Candidatus Cloacimonadota bacterium]